MLFTMHVYLVVAALFVFALAENLNISYTTTTPNGFDSAGLELFWNSGAGWFSISSTYKPSD